MNAYHADLDWLNEIPIPPLTRVRQRFPGAHVEAVEAAVTAEWGRLGLSRQMRPGLRVAIAVGSRGVAAIDRIVTAVAASVRAAGAEPFIIPAMGSHGGATAAGQEAVLRELGVTPEVVRAPIASAMATREIGRVRGMPIHVAETALAADAVIVVNRIKPHTDFRGPIESGLAKICTIGLGKHQGARTVHAHGIHGLRDLVPEAARVIVREAGVIAGFGVVENAYHQVQTIEALPGTAIGGPAEERLLEQARSSMARLPLAALDVLVVDRMGKEISGSGLDTNVIGRMEIHGQPDFGGPDITNIVVLDLTPASQGNAQGIGLADFTIRALVDRIDWHKTYVNTITSGICAVRRAKLPVVLPDAETAIRAAIASSGRPRYGDVTLARIASTLELDQFDVSPQLLAGLPNSCEILRADSPSPRRKNGPA